MTQTISPASIDTPSEVPEESAALQDLHLLLQGLAWKNGLTAKVRKSLKKKKQEPIANILKKRLSHAVRNAKGVEQYREGLLSLLDLLCLQNPDAESDAQTSHDRDLVTLLQQLILIEKKSQTEPAADQRVAREIWLAELHSLLAHEWSQIEPDAHSGSGGHVETAQPELLDLFLLTQVLLLSCDLITDELFLTLWSLLYRHLEFVKESLELPCESEEFSLEIILTRVELPILMGVIFGQSLKSIGLFRAGKKSFSVELCKLTDTDGTPHASLMPILPQFMASLTRTIRLAKWFDRKLFSPRTRPRWEDLVKRAAAMTCCDGTLISTSSSPADWKTTLLEAINSHSRRRRAHWAIQSRLCLEEASPSKKSPSTSGQSKKGMDQTAATNSAWGHLACLRSNWYPGADLLGILHDRPDTSFQLTALGQTVFQGPWLTKLSIDGEPHNLGTEWSSSCWFSDKTGDFLELRNETASAIIDRQIFLSRTDHIALLSDTVFAKEPDRRIELCWELPLAGQWNEKKKRETRELFLKNKQFRLGCIPLGLPQDRTTAADGAIEVNRNHLCLKQHGKYRLTMPLLLDWSPVRKKNHCDWNRLTVTENRKALSVTDTFAARCRIGKHQWLYLRNMEFSGLPRAVLGLHTDAESVFAEFPQTGIAEKLVEVHYGEADD